MEWNLAITTSPATILAFGAAIWTVMGFFAISYLKSFGKELKEYSRVIQEKDFTKSPRRPVYDWWTGKVVQQYND